MAYSSLKRGLVVLEHIADSREGLTVSEVSQIVDCDKGSASRLLGALRDMGFVRRKGTRGPFVVGTRVMEMGLQAVAGLDASNEARPVVEALSESLQHMAYFAVRTEDRVMPVVTVSPPNALQIHNCLGATFSLHCSAAGKNYLAHMPAGDRERLLARAGLARHTGRTITRAKPLELELARVRRRGYAVDNEETETGLRCVSAPVFDVHGDLAGALGITGLASVLTPGKVRACAVEIRHAAAGLSGDLGCQSPHRTRPAARTELPGNPGRSLTTPGTETTPRRGDDRMRP